MKNLKKILIALAVVALLVSSAALLVGAEDEYTGKLETLYSNYKNVDATAPASTQSATLAEAYEYLTEKPVDPASTIIVSGADNKLPACTEKCADEDGNSRCDVCDASMCTSHVDTDKNDKCDKCQDNTVTYTYGQVVDMIKASSVEIGTLLYTEAQEADSASAISKVAVLMNHLTACPAESVDGYAELVANAKLKNVAVVAEQCELAAALETPDEKSASVVAIYDHVAAYPLDATANADVITAMKTLACDVAEELYTAWTEIPADQYFARYNGIYSAKYYIAKVNLLTNGVAASGLSDKESAAVEKINKGCQTMDAEMLQKQIALDAQASFDEYDYGEPYLAYDGVNDTMKPINATEHCLSQAATDIFGKKYQNLHYGSVSSHLYVEPSPGNKNAYELGMVIEWDQFFDDGFTGIEYVCRHPGVSMTTAFTIDKKEGVITITNNTKNNSKADVEAVSAAGVVASNVWTHFTITYDHETRLGKLYVNYEYVCGIEYSDVASFQFVGFRMGKRVADQNHGYANFSAMNGSSYRIWNRFSLMSVDEQFNFYVDYMVDEENPSLSRNSAYKKAKLLYATVKGDSDLSKKCAEALAAYAACDYNEEIKKPAMAQNLGILSEMVDELLIMEVSSATTKEVNDAMKEINEFISTNGELINKGDTSEGGYQSLMMKVNTVKEKLIATENIAAFVAALKKFDRATTLTSMSKYAAEAEAIYVLAAYDIPENVEFAKKDPIVAAFEEVLNADLLPEDEEYEAKYVDLFEYYENVAKKVADRALYENAKRIISCVDFVTSLDGYEATPEFWSKNADYISTYVAVARDIIVSGNYKTDVEGLDEAIATFRILDVYFYELLQQQHIAAIEEQLAKYLDTEIYIDKVGVCAVVNQYLAQNDIAIYNTDMTPEVAAAVADEIAQLEELIVIYGVYNDELEAQKGDYEAVLAQNTQYFINTVNHMDTVLTYAELKPLFDKATGYYYSIDVDGEAAAAAADKYIAYREQLEILETEGAIFIGYVNGLAEAKKLSGVERDDAIYAILVKCIAYVDIVDEGVSGVASAMAKYESALADYNEELAIVNSDISESVKITCAVRTNSISNIVLAIVSKIFED